MIKSLYLRWQTLVHELAKFGIVGAINTVIDFGIFNALRAGFDVGPLTSSTIALVVAATSSYLMNRYWTFRHRARSGLGREYLLFFVLNGIGLGIQLSCIGVSHYLLGYTSLYADNLAKVVGLLIGTVFRFLTYKRWVFLEPEAAAGRSIGEGSVSEFDTGEFEATPATPAATAANSDAVGYAGSGDGASNGHTNGHANGNGHAAAEPRTQGFRARMRRQASSQRG
jgi:putative flippase GtrA